MTPSGRALATDLLAQIRAEIDARIAELRPAVEEYERLLEAAEALEREAAAARAAPSGAGESLPPAAPARRRGPRGSAAGAIARAASGARAPTHRTERAIVAALEHGSHTVGELVVVTAMSGAQIRASLRALQRAGKVVRTTREGRAAYALAQSA